MSFLGLSISFALPWPPLAYVFRVYGWNRFNFYAAAPARTDPSVCPEDSDAIMVLVPCPNIPDDGPREGEGGEDVDRRGGWVKRAREGVIREMEASAGMEGFGDSIVREEVYAPWDWRDR